jgi:hypothetical protein
MAQGRGRAPAAVPPPAAAPSRWLQAPLPPRPSQGPPKLCAGGRPFPQARRRGRGGAPARASAHWPRPRAPPPPRRAHRQSSAAVSAPARASGLRHAGPCVRSAASARHAGAGATPSIARARWVACMSWGGRGRARAVGRLQGWGQQLGRRPASHAHRAACAPCRGGVVWTAGHPSGPPTALPAFHRPRPAGPHTPPALGRTRRKSGASVRPRGASSGRSARSAAIAASEGPWRGRRGEGAHVAATAGWVGWGAFGCLAATLTFGDCMEGCQQPPTNATRERVTSHP